MSDRFPEQMLQAGDNNLDPIAGAKLNFYITGTTTRKDTYSDDAKTIPNANPVVADSAGRFGDIFMDTDVAYKVVYTDAADVVIQTFDPFDPVRATNVVETPVTTKSSNFTVLESERGHLYEIDASAGSINATLLAAATAANNFEIGFKKVDSSANPVTVDGNGSETIDGDLEQELANQYDVIVLVCDGTTWHIKSDNRAIDAPLPRDYISDIEFVNGGGTPDDPNHDVTIPIHESRDSADGVNIINAVALTKQGDASWAAGTNQGGLSSSLTFSADTTYYIFDIIVADAADVGFDTDPDAANLIADHSATAYRQIGSFRTKAASANIIESRFMTVVPGGKRFTFNAEATTSGSEVIYSGIDPDVTEIVMGLDGVSTTGVGNLTLEIGPDSGVETSGYLSRWSQGSGLQSGSVTGFVVFAGVSASDTFFGDIKLTLIDPSTNTWTMSGHLGESTATGEVAQLVGSKSLAGPLGILRLSTSDAFDAGKVGLHARSA